MPTFQVIADLNLLSSYQGLTLPLMASATRPSHQQFFKTIPNELVEAKIDSAGPMKFFFDPAAAVAHQHRSAVPIFFTFGWNQTCGPCW